MLSRMLTRNISTLSLPKRVKIVEVGVRDGLQNEKKVIPVEIKVELAKRLVATGISYVEAGSFVSPKWVPQMAATDQVFAELQKCNFPDNVTFAGLTPNMKGLEGAIASKVKEVAVFAAASEAFTMKNTNVSIAGALERQGEVTSKALELGMTVRGYVSCVLGCPYEGDIQPEKVLEVAKVLLDRGCYEVSFGDTIGSGNPLSTHRLLTVLKEGGIPVEKIAVHFHDTRGLALANILVALQHGVTVIDSSVSGLGGCPYAVGATGNVATEDVVYMCQGMGIETGVNLAELIKVGQFIDGFIGRQCGSKAATALAKKLL